MSENIETTAYLVVEGRRARYAMRDEITGLKPVERVAIVGMRQTYPTRVTTDQVIVKVRIALPANIFDPLVPTAIVVVPEDMVRRGTIEVEAVEHDDEG